MRLAILLFACLSLLFSCKNKDKIDFVPYKYKNAVCSDCPKIDIEYPKTVEKTKLNTTINTAIEEEIIFLLTYDDEMETTTLEQGIDAFKNGYLKIKELHPEEATLWEAKINGTVSYETKQIITITLDIYSFTGGAHGYTSKTFLNFDKITGEELETEQLFTDIDAFTELSEQYFKVKENIPLDEDINSTGLMFEGGTFYLPENIGYTKEGIQLLYNQYEVSSFADGNITITIPYKKARPFLATTKTTTEP